LHCACPPTLQSGAGFIRILALSLTAHRNRVMKTFSAKPQTVRHDWFVVDASGKTLGRLATEVARRLRGKHKPEYTPHVDTGDYIVVVNAKDAMLDGGELTIRTRNVTERECQKMDHFGLQVGEYVIIEVSDTGTGMSPDVLNKIFEPFFTTKGVGKGTGLGLATVYGIVKQSGGFIFPESEIGKGTTFRVFLPRYVPDAEEEAAIQQRQARREARHAPDVTGSGRVLLVEDEDGVRSFAVRALRSRGFEVLEATNGAEALELIEANDGNLDIVVSDVVMPEVDGPTLLKTLRKTHPDLKFVFMSGYPNDAFRAGFDSDENYGFLPKPFSLAQLVSKVKQELAG